jgi:glutamate-ammonia-ligase adenylyltransferase
VSTPGPQALFSRGFSDPARGLAHLAALTRAAGAGLPAGWEGRLVDRLAATPDPDLALLQMTRLVEGPQGRERLVFLLRAPRALDAVAAACGGSPFLGDSLVRHGEWLEWLCAPEVLQQQPTRPQLRRELSHALRGAASEAVGLDVLRVFKRRQTLRIGVRDLLRLASVEETLVAVSRLADVLIAGAHRLCGLDDSLVVFALGKLGGEELNFSSDVDLVYVHGPASDEDHVHRLCRKLTSALAHITDEGAVYRVDLRLRPEGRSGPIVRGVPSFISYYATRGEAWERLALLKARPAAGDRHLAARCLAGVRSFMYEGGLDAAALAAIRRLKTRMDAHMVQRDEDRRHVKLGFGGIREIELVVQVLQIAFGARRPALRRRPTLRAIAALERTGLLLPAEARALVPAYLFLRDVENKLQMVHDAQTHVLPREVAERRALALRLGYVDGPTTSCVEAFEADYAGHTERVNAIFRAVLIGDATAPPAVLERRARRVRRA